MPAESDRAATRRDTPSNAVDDREPQYTSRSSNRSARPSSPFRSRGYSDASQERRYSRPYNPRFADAADSPRGQPSGTDWHDRAERYVKRPVSPEQSNGYSTPAYRRYSYQDRAPDNTSPSWTPGHKRPLSPSNKQQGRSFSPPVKIRRWGDTQSASDHTNPPQLRSQHATFQDSVSSNGPEGNSGSGFIAHTPGAGSTPSSAATPVAPSSSEALSLNRELWDVRRQITALKAREDNILTELKGKRVPELPEAAVKQNGPSPEERMKTMEFELSCTYISLYLSLFLPRQVLAEPTVQA